MNTVFAQSELERSVDWLKKNQNEDGSWAFGIHQEHLAASAMIALYEVEEYAAVANASNWLKQQIEDFSSAVWKSGEADIPAIIIYSFYVTENENTIDIINVSEKLMNYQNINNESKYYGGFRGFMENMEKPIENTVDTAFSLIALLNYENFTDRRYIAIEFLKKLQNEDGSFNLTFNTKHHPLYSLAPDPISLTALSSIALTEAGENNHEAIGFLKSSARSCFGDERRSYSVALSAIAFDKAGELEYAETAVNYLKILQNADGGFSDHTRQNPDISNALDTAWAVIAFANIENTTSDICTPIDVELTIENEIIQPLEIQNISLSILGAVSNVTINITCPNGTLVKFPINYSENVTYYEIIFDDTTQIGTYNVDAQVKPIYGESIIFNDFFESKDEDATTTTMTTTTQSSGGRVSGGESSGGGTVFTSTSIITTTTTIATITTPTAPITSIMPTSVCGNKKCEIEESQINCCLDCECPKGQTCNITSNACYVSLITSVNPLTGFVSLVTSPVGISLTIAIVILMIAMLNLKKR